MRKIGIKVSHLQEKIDNGQRPEWAMRWVEKHMDHYADKGRTIAVVPLEAWNKVLDACGEPPKESPDYGAKGRPVQRNKTQKKENLPGRDNPPCKHAKWKLERPCCGDKWMCKNEESDNYGLVLSGKDCQRCEDRSR